MKNFIIKSFKVLILSISTFFLNKILKKKPIEKKILYVLTIFTVILFIQCPTTLKDENNNNNDYNGKVTTPTFDLTSGTYDSAQIANISTITTGASIKYTKDNSDPKTSSTAIIGTTVNVDQSMDIKAYAYKSEWVDSDIATGNYIICLQRFDDFEDGDATDDSWIDAGGAYDITADNLTAANGTNYSVSINKSGLNGYYDGIYRNLNNISPRYVSFYARSSATSTSDGYFVLFNQAGRSAGNQVIYFAFSLGANMALNGTLTNMPSYLNNTWYHIEFKNINWITQTFDCYVDGEIERPNEPFKNDATSFSYIDLYNWSGISHSWFDEITIMEY